jgi:hypothetical protein
MGAFRGTQPFLQNQSWQNQALNALHYNTSQVGSVIPLLYGTVRQQVNLIALGHFSGPSGKKGTQGTLPLTGTNTTRAGGKGGGGGKGASKKTGTGKKSQDFNIEVDFGMCHGPIAFPNNNLVFANAGVETFNAAQAHFYSGADGQAPDPVFLSRGVTAGYSGTCHITFTPMDLGSAPALPNLSFELNGFLTGTGGPTFPVDANPGFVILDFLTNPRYGAGFPINNMQDLRPGVGNNSYGDYCQAAQFAVSTALDAQQKAGEWLDGLAKLTNTAIVWSGELLKFVPYGDLTLGANGALWTPNLVPEYSLTDHDFLPWHPHQDGAGPTPGDDDPVLVTRTNPADAVNWLEIEYTERDNFYNVAMIPAFDQSAIDLYGLRTGENLPGKAFCNATSAQTSAQIYLQRLLYVRNFYKFKLGWQFCRLEPMDLVLLTDGGAGLEQQPVRITAIEEDENGDLTIEAEELSTGFALPPPPRVSFAIGSFPPVTGATTTPASITVSINSTNPAPMALLTIVAHSSASLVSSIIDSFGLRWSQRIGYTSTDNLTRLEVWWADFTAVPGGTHFSATVRFNAGVYLPSVTFSDIQGNVNTSTFWDSNPSVPNEVSDNSVIPASGPITTSSPTAALISWLVTADQAFGSTFVVLGGNSPQFVGSAGLGYGYPDGNNYINFELAGSFGLLSPLQQFRSYVAVPAATITGNTSINPNRANYMLVVDAVAGT